MKVLLVNSNRETTPWPVVPVGLSLVATATEDAGHSVELVDLTLSRHPVAALRRVLLGRQPEVVGVTVRNIDNCNFEAPHFYLDEIRDQVIQVVRELLPESLIVLGGSAVNIAPQLVLEYVGADCALAGEGEASLPQLLSVLEGKSTQLPAGLYRRRVSSCESTQQKTLSLTASASGHGPSGFERAPNFVERSLAYRWTNWGAYARHGASYPLQTKRGCALRCSYCVYNTLEGTAYRLRTVAAVINEIEDAMRHGVDRFEFVDSTFNIPKSHALAICKELSERKLGAKFSTMGLNPRNVDDELVDAMLGSGFDNVMCSAESASNAILTSMAKDYTQAHIARTAAALRRCGMPTYWFFLLGAPGESAATVAETISFCNEHIPNEHMVLFATGLRILPGTPLELHCRQTGWLSPTDSLLEPTWYLSPQLDLEALAATLAEQTSAHPNWMVNGEAALSPRKAFAMKTGFRLLGWHGPFWKHLPRVFGLAAKFGARERGIRSAWRGVLAASDVTHRR